MLTCDVCGEVIIPQAQSPSAMVFRAVIGQLDPDTGEKREDAHLAYLYYTHYGDCARVMQEIEEHALVEEARNIKMSVDLHRARLLVDKGKKGKRG